MGEDSKRFEKVLAGVQDAPRGTWEFARDTLRAARAVAHGFRGENISLRAAALTYVSLLALVPLGTMALAVAKAVGHEQLRRAVRDFVLAQLAPGAQQGTLDYFDQFLNRAGSGILGTLGAALLVFSALDLLWNIERSLNDIWAVPKHRSWAPRLAVYWAILTLGPVILGLSVAGTSDLEGAVGGIGLSIPRSLSSAMHIGASTVGLTILYWVTPNAPVRIRSAFAGGIVSAAAWEIAKHGYAVYVSRSFSYGAIYGALAAIPFFFVWIYVSWWIVLFGARLAYAVQNVGTGGVTALGTVRAREVLCAQVLMAICQRFLEGLAAPSASEIAVSTKTSEPEARQALGYLHKARLVAEDGAGAYTPARNPKNISLAEVSRAALGAATDSAIPSSLPTPVSCFLEADQASTAVLASIDFEQLSRKPTLLKVAPSPPGTLAKP